MPGEEAQHFEKVLSQKLKPFVQELEHVFANNQELQNSFQKINDKINGIEQEIQHLGSNSREEVIQKEKILENELDELNSLINEIDSHINYSLLSPSYRKKLKAEKKDIQLLVRLLKREVKISEHFENGELDREQLKKEINGFEEQISEELKPVNLKEFNTSEEFREKIFLKEIQKNSNNQGVVETSLFKFTDTVLKQYREALGLSSDVDLNKGAWQQTATNLSKKGYQHSIDLEFDHDKKSIKFKVASHKKEIVDKYVERKLDERLHEVNSAYETVNKQLKILEEKKQNIQSSGLPTYDSSTSDLKELADYYVSSMEGYVENHLNLHLGIEKSDFVVERDQMTGYHGKSNGRHRITLTKNPKVSSDYYPTGFETLVKHFEEAPTGADGQREVEVTMRQPDIAVVDLLHEVGHMVANVIVAEKKGMRDKGYGNSNSPVKSEMGAAGNEKTANELAMAQAKAFSTKGGAWRDILPALKAYIELTKFGNSAAGYADQHPIRADRSTVKELFAVEKHEKQGY